MKKRAILLILATMVFTYGCGVSGGEGEIQGSAGAGAGANVDTTHPTILATVPCDCGANLVTDATVTALFSEAMDPLSINDSTFYVKDSSNNNIVGTISYSGTKKTATFKPVSNLSSNTTYTVTISGAKDSAGNWLEPKTWQFHTGSLQSTVKFADIQGILTSNCISCHTSGGASPFLPLTEDVSYENIVAKHSNYTTGTLVYPGKSQSSILYKRVSGTSVGAQMPKDLPFLNSTSQNVIKTWIDEGALNN